MTIIEIQKMQERPAESPQALSLYLEEALEKKMFKLGLIEVDVMIPGLSRKKLMAFPLSKNLCLTEAGPRDFVSFTGKLVLIHIPSGVRIATIRINRKEAVQLARKMEAAANLECKNSEELYSMNSSEDLATCKAYLEHI